MENQVKAKIDEVMQQCQERLSSLEAKDDSLESRLLAIEERRRGPPSTNSPHGRSRLSSADGGDGASVPEVTPGGGPSSDYADDPIDDFDQLVRRLQEVEAR